jgi:hypothetical protein
VQQGIKQSLNEVRLYQNMIRLYTATFNYSQYLFEGLMAPNSLQAHQLKTDIFQNVIVQSNQKLAHLIKNNYKWLKTGSKNPKYIHNVRMKMTVFWDVVPCSLVEIHRCFRGAYCLHHQNDRPHDGGSKHFWNVFQFLRDYTVQHPRRPSYSPP